MLTLCCSSDIIYWYGSVLVAKQIVKTTAPRKMSKDRLKWKTVIILGVAWRE